MDISTPRILLLFLMFNDKLDDPTSETLFRTELNFIGTAFMHTL
jgi:hypothetical protein